MANFDASDTQPSLSHLDNDGQARMVDISSKPVTQRQAIAEGYIRMHPNTLTALQTNDLPKGNLLNTAQLAGIMAAKQTANLIPLCHPLALQSIDIEIEIDEDRPGYRIQAIVKTAAETGVEMEALTAVSVAALTIYDMAKALEKSMQIEDIRLISKTGGQSGEYHRNHKDKT